MCIGSITFEYVCIFSLQASRVHEDVDDDNVLGMMTPGLGQGDDDDDDDMHLDPEQFKALQQEVERLGAL